MRISIEKLEFIINLIEENKTYREIQNQLKLHFGSGVSNSTLKNIMQEMDESRKQEREIDRLKKELSIFKRLYFEIIEEIEKKGLSKEFKSIKNSDF